MSKLFSLIEDGEVHPASNQKVIPLEDFSTLMEASSFLRKHGKTLKTFALQLKPSAYSCSRLQKKKVIKKDSSS